MKNLQKLIFVGLSRDNRTNKWKVICSCGKSDYAPTTMFFESKFQCNKCGKEWLLNYNQETITEVNQ